MPSESHVIVVGAGASGLSAAAALARRGIEAVVLEQDEAIGGTWARRYDRLHLHTIRQFSGLAHFPVPRSYPRYLSRDDVVDYLNQYARHFGLSVITGTAVRRIRPRTDAPDGWIVEANAANAWHGTPALTRTPRLTPVSACSSSARGTAAPRLPRI